MTIKTKEELLAQFDEVNDRLSWREEKGILKPEEHALIELSNLLRPFLEVFADIRDILMKEGKNG